MHHRLGDYDVIRLRTSSIIVTAAKQPSGHLYVQTKDMTVSIIGTVFLVNAETNGSRVAVIEGEARVREIPATKVLDLDNAHRRVGSEDSGTVPERMFAALRASAASRINCYSLTRPSWTLAIRGMLT